MENTGQRIVSQEDQELLMQASFLENQSRELEQNLEIVENEISELGNFLEGIRNLIASKETKTFSPLGKGVFLETNIESKKLLVNIGQNLFVKKTPESAITVIEIQLARLREVRTQIMQQLQEYTSVFTDILKKIEQIKIKQKQN